MGDKPESQTTLETTVVGGLDIFRFGAADVVGSPGAPSPEQATPASEKEEHPGEATETPAPGAAPTTEKPPAPAEPPPKRFKTHDEAERGYKELQGKTTKAEQEAAEARRAADTAKAEADVAKAALAEAETRLRQADESKIEAARQEVVDAAIEVYATDRRAAALKEINALDPDDPEHDTKVAKIWGKHDAAVLKFSRNPVGPDGKPIGKVEPAAPAAPAAAAKPAAAPAAAAAPATAAKPAAATPEPDAAEAEKRKTDVINYIDGKARAAGIDPDDELWWGISRTAPDKDDKGQRLTIDQQIDWTINRYNERIAAITATARQNAELPLGGGGHGPGGPGGPPAAPAEGPASLDSAIGKAKEARRL